MTNIIKFLIQLLPIIFLISCDLFIKRNPQDLLNNTNEDKISYLGEYSIPASTATFENMIISSDNKNLYVTDSLNYIYQFNINENGSLNLIITRSGPGVLSFSLALDANNNLYTGDVYSGNIFRFDIFDKNLNLIRVVDTGGTEPVISLLISPDKKNLYVFTGTSSPYLCYIYLIKPEGKLNLTGVFNVISNNVAPINEKMYFSIDGKFLYFFEETTTAYHIYKRNPESGDLNEITNNNSASFSPAQGYVTNNQMSIYGIDGSATANNNYIIKVSRNLKTGTISNNQQTLIHDSTTMFHNLIISNDNKFLFFTKVNMLYGVNYFNKYNLEKNQIEFNYQAQSSVAFESKAVSKDDRFIYIGARNTTTSETRSILIFTRIIN